MCPPCAHCSGSRLLCWEPSEAGPGLPAPPRSKPLRFRHLGSPRRRRLGWASVLCPSQVRTWLGQRFVPFPVRAAQVLRCLVSPIAATYRLPAARLSRCTTGTPSQTDVDCPEAQEVLAKKPAYSFIGNVSLGLRLPPSSFGCLSPEGDGLQPAISVQSYVLCMGLVVS